MRSGHDRHNHNARLQREPIHSLRWLLHRGRPDTAIQPVVRRTECCTASRPSNHQTTFVGVRTHIAHHARLWFGVPVLSSRYAVRHRAVGIDRLARIRTAHHRLGRVRLVPLTVVKEPSRCKANRRASWCERFEQVNALVANGRYSFSTCMRSPSACPIQPTVPGVVELHDPLTIRTQSEGTLKLLHVRHSQSVEPGQLLAEFQNLDLQNALNTKRIEVALTTESIAVFSALAVNLPKPSLNKPNSFRLMNS